MKQQQQYTAEQLLLKYEYNPQFPPPEDKTVFLMEFKRIGSLGDYILFTGKKSSGKTKYISGAIAASLTRADIFNFRIKLPDHKRKVAHFDTEQGRVSHFKQIQLIQKLSAMDHYPDNFKSYLCRNVAPHQILLMVEHYLNTHPDTGMIFLDGMLDTVDSMNDEKASASMKRWMQRLSDEHDILIAGVIHRGFSADKSIGHIGSYLERGAQTVFAIEKKSQNGFSWYEIRTEYIRDDAPPSTTAIWYNDNISQWEVIDPSMMPTKEGMPGVASKLRNLKPHEYDISQHMDYTRQIFKSQSLQNFKKFIERIMEVYCIGRNAAIDIKKYLVAQAIVYDTGEGYTNEQQAKLFIASKK